MDGLKVIIIIMRYSIKIGLVGLGPRYPVLLYSFLIGGGWLGVGGWVGNN